MDQEILKQPSPWAKRREIGFFSSLWQTIRRVLFTPSDFFANLEIKNSQAEPFWFYFILAMAGTLISSLWSYLLRRPQLSVWSIIFIPVLMAIFFYVGAALIHLGVRLFRGKGKFNSTFNVLAYSAAVRILDIIPLIGAAVGAIWAFIVIVIGLKQVHKFSTGRALLAYIVPIVPFLAVGIIIPNLLRARLVANETAALASVKTISTATEVYNTANGNFPSKEEDLTMSKPPYLNNSFDGKTIQGYNYSLRFEENGYEIVARPFKCGSTGRIIYKAIPGKKQYTPEVSEEKCSLVK